VAELRPEYEATVAEFSFVEAVESVDGRLVVTLDDPEEQNPALVAALVNAGAQVQFVGEIRKSLEDVYLHLMDNGNAAPEPGDAT
jgi:ABC-2 type transport system ATP-binding protein